MASRMKEGGSRTDCPFRNTCIAKLVLVSTSLLMPSSFGYKIPVGSQVQGLMTVILALRTWKQEGESRPVSVIGLSGDKPGKHLTVHRTAHQKRTTQVQILTPTEIRQGWRKGSVGSTHYSRMNLHPQNPHKARCHKAFLCSPVRDGRQSQNNLRKLVSLLA